MEVTLIENRKNGLSDTLLYYFDARSCKGEYVYCTFDSSFDLDPIVSAESRHCEFVNDPSLGIE